MKKTILPLILISAAFIACGPKKQDEVDTNKKEYVQTTNFVDTVILRRNDFVSQNISNGKLRAYQKSNLNFRSSGAIRKLNVVNGQHIDKDAIIAEIDTREAYDNLYTARLGLQKAYLDLQDKLLDFGYHIEDSLSIPQEHMRISKLRSGYEGAVSALQKAEIALEGCFIKAPFAGKIANLKTKLHENPQGDAFCTLINDVSFDAEFNVLETEIGNVREGQSIQVSTFVDPSMRYSGRITNINPTVDDKGQVLVTANIPNPGKLIDGMNVKIFIENFIPQRLVVPKNAVLVRDNHEVLFRYGPDGKAMWTYVIVEMSNSTSHAVRANTDRGAELNEGDAIITSGNLNLADGSTVEIIK